MAPVLGVTAFSDFIASLIGIIIPFVAGIAIVLLSDALKQFAKLIIASLGKWLHARHRKRAQRREILEKILLPGMSVEEYLNQEEKMCHQTKTKKLGMEKTLRDILTATSPPKRMQPTRKQPRAADAPAVRRPKGRGKHTIPVMKEFLCQDKVHRVQDKVLHCSALYGIIVLTKDQPSPDEEA